MHLIAPLGLIPGTVTCAFHALRNKKIGIEKVSLLTTQSVKNRRVSEIVKAYFDKLDIACSDYVLNIDDIRSTADVATFRAMLSLLIEKSNTAGEDIVISVAGGRKTMSAQVAIAAQLHTISYLVDLWVSENVENDTKMADNAGWQSIERAVQAWDGKSKRPDTLKCLHPDAGEYALIELPVLPLHDLGETIRETSTLALSKGFSVIVQMDGSRLNKFLLETPGRLDTEHAEILLDLEKALRQPGSASGADSLKEIFEHQLRLDIQTNWPAVLRSGKSLQVDNTIDEFKDKVIDTLQQQFDSSKIPVNLLKVWQQNREIIINLHGNKARADQYLASLLVRALKTGYRLPRLDDAQRARLRGNVFISYSHKDDKSKVRELVSALEFAGVTVWWDEKLTPGSHWNGVIRRAMEECQVCLVVVTENSMFSPFIRKEEVPHFLTPGKWLVPLLFDGITRAKLDVAWHEIPTHQMIDFYQQDFAVKFAELLYKGLLHEVI